MALIKRYCIALKTANHPFITIQADKVPFKIPILLQNDKVGQLCDKI